MTKSKFISLEEFKLKERFYQDIENQIPSIWTVVYGDKAQEYYQEYVKQGQ